MIRYVDGNEIKTVEKDCLDIKDGILLFKDDNVFIAKEESRLEALDYEDVIYKLYIRNKKNKRIYFVGMDEEEVAKMEMTGRVKKAYTFDFSLIKSAPKYVDEDRKVKSEYIMDENLLDIKYTVKEGNHSESFNLKMNIIFDASLEYHEGEILNEEYMDGVRKQLEERVKTHITLKEYSKDNVKVKTL